MRNPKHLGVLRDNLKRNVEKMSQFLDPKRIIAQGGNFDAQQALVMIADTVGLIAMSQAYIIEELLAFDLDAPPIDGGKIQ